MKALEKSRDRRYETANGLAADVQRYLDDEPVVACPPSTAYRIRKLVRRNRGPVVAAAAVGVSLVAGICGTSIGLLQARHEADAARQAEGELRKAYADLENSTLQVETANSALEQSKQHLEEANRELADKNSQIGQALLQQALASAMSGNEEGTQHHLAVAKEAGASQADSEFIMGVLEWGRNRSAPAISHLERAAELDEQHVAARAILVALYIETGGGKYAKVRRELATLTPKTPIDYLCLGLNRGDMDADLGVRNIERGLEMHTSPIARAIYGLVLSLKALMDRDLPLARKALLELAQAEAVIGESSFLTSTRLSALNATISLARGEGHDTDALELAADRCASQLVDAPNMSAIHMWHVANYHERIKGDVTAAREAYQRAVELQQGGSLWTHYYAAFLLRNDGVDAALKALKSVEGSTQAALLMALHPEYRESLRATWKDIGFKRVALLVGKALGLHDEARLAAVQWKKPSTSRYEAALIDLMVGKSGAAEQIEEWTDRSGVYRSCGANKWVGLIYLTQGNRRKAKEHFERVVATGYYHQSSYGWAEGYLELMKEDPEWPHITPDESAL